MIDENGLHVVPDQEVPKKVFVLLPEIESDLRIIRQAEVMRKHGATEQEIDQFANKAIRKTYPGHHGMTRMEDVA